MKKSFLFIALAFAGNLFSQASFSLSVKSTSAAIAPNAVLTATTIPEGKHTITIDMTNTSAVTHTYDVKRYDIVVNQKAVGDSAVPNFCFATLCTGKDVTVSLNPLILKAGESASTDTAAEYNMLDADLIEATSKGFSYVKYTLYESNNPNDSVQFAISYNTELKLVGIKKQVENISGLNIYPNPAKTEANVLVTVQKEGASVITVMNAIGQVVINKEVPLSTGKNSVSLNLQDLAAGVYFVKVQQDDSSNTQKLIVE